VRRGCRNKLGLGSIGRIWGRYLFDAVCFGVSEIDAVERVREVGEAGILMSVAVLRGLRRRECIDQ
jgi:hypothetical protein